MVPTTHYVVLSLILFGIGAVGVLVRRNTIIVLMSLELMFNAANINLVVFSSQLQNLGGQVFAVFVIAIAAGEAAIGLAILLALFRNKSSIHLDETTRPSLVPQRLNLERRQRNLRPGPHKRQRQNR